MLKLFKYLGTTVLAVFIVALILPYFISLNTYKGQIQDKVMEMTGRKLELKGDIKFRVLPRPYLKLKDIQFESIDGTVNDQLAEVDSVEVSLSILPLLKGKISVDEVRLKEPKLYLEKTSNGKVNWDIMPKVDQVSKEEKTTLETKETSSSFQLHIGHVKIRNGSLLYREKGEEYDLSNVDLDVRFDALKGPFDIEAKLKAVGQEIEFAGRLEGIEGTVPIDMKIKALGKTGKLTGTIDLDKLAFDTKLALEGRLTDLKSYMPALSIPDHLKKSYKLHAEVSGDLDDINVKELVFELGPLKANGAANIDLKKMIGGLKLRLMPGEIDFDIKPTSTNPKNLRATVSLTSKNSKQFLQALHVNVSEIPAYLLQAFSLKTQLGLKGDELSLTGIDLDAGKAKLNGDVSVKNWDDDDVSYTFNVRTVNASALAALLGATAPKELGAVKVIGKASGKPSQLALSADIYAANAKTSIAGEVKIASKTVRPTLRVKTAGKNLKSTLQRLGVKNLSHNLGAYKADVFLSGDYPQRLKVKVDESRFAMNRDQLAAKGDLDLFLGRVKPKLSANFTLSSLDLDKLLAYLNGQKLQNVAKRIPTPKKPRSRWSHERIDLSALRGFDGDINIRIPQLKKGSLVFDDIKSSLRVANGVMDVTSLKGNLYGGTLDMKARVSSQKGQSVTMTAHLKNAKLKNIAPKGKSIKVLKGDFSLDADLTTSGQSEYQFVSNLSGALNFKGTEGAISGFDVSRVVERLKSVRNVGDILSILDSTFSGGTSAFRSVNAVSTITKGTLKLTKFDLDAIKARITAEGTVSLIKYVMAINARVVLAVKDLPPFGVHFYGPIDNPAHSIKAEALQSYLIQNVLTGVIDNIQKGDGSPQSIVKGILGLGGREKQPDAQQGNERRDPRQKQQNQQPRQRQRQTGDPIEKAVEGLLNNLF